VEALTEEAIMASEPTLKELLETMIRALVDIPEDVKISEISGEQTTVFELVVAKEDLGKVIGKQGKTAKALRTILTGASTKLRKRSVLEIVE
jgi:predicted RNA-binding protein YlqC (UPF0109 family)